MYDDLVKRLRAVAGGGREEKCDGCPCEEDYPCCVDCLDKLHKQAADAIEELSKRETPMRMRVTTSTKRCPSCNKQLSKRGNIHRNYRFCRWCGQALDWTEPPKGVL